MPGNPISKETFYKLYVEQILMQEKKILTMKKGFKKYIQLTNFEMLTITKYIELTNFKMLIIVLFYCL